MSTMIESQQVIPGIKARYVPCAGKDWLAMRHQGIGGSDAPSVLGLSPFRSNVQLYLEKRGLAPAQVESETMYWGTALEPAIRQHYCNRNRCEVFAPTGVLIHPEHEWMRASIDGVTVTGDRGLEIKKVRSTEGWGADGTNEIPVYYLTQVHHYLTVTGLPVWDVGVLFGGQEYRQYEIEADAEISESLIEQEHQFWLWVQEGIEPEPKNIDDAKALYPTAYPIVTHATQDLVSEFNRLKEIDDQIDAATEQRNEIQARLMAFMGEADTLVFGDKTLATWKQCKGRMSLDGERLKKERPEVYSQFLKTGEMTRRFLLKGKA